MSRFFVRTFLRLGPFEGPLHSFRGPSSRHALSARPLPLSTVRAAPQRPDAFRAPPTHLLDRRPRRASITDGTPFEYTRGQCLRFPCFMIDVVANTSRPLPRSLYLRHTRCSPHAARRSNGLQVYYMSSVVVGARVHGDLNLNTLLALDVR